MKKFEVTITETLKKTVTVEANNIEEAEQLVSDRWPTVTIFLMLRTLLEPILRRNQ